MKRYYLTGFVAVDAESPEEADRLFNEAGLGAKIEIVEGVVLDIPGGDWDHVEDVDDEGCTCPPGLAERGGFASTCPVHAPGSRGWAL